MADATQPHPVKICPRCDAAFNCCGGSGWCAAVNLTLAQREALRRQYTDCLCARCLREVAESSPPGTPPRQ